jgi:hypothetical protein
LWIELGIDKHGATAVYPSKLRDRIDDYDS